MNIPEEAIEAAAKALHDLGATAKQWHERDEEIKDMYREDASTAIAALAPYVASKAWEEGFEGAQGVYPQSNPYKV